MYFFNVCLKFMTLRLSLFTTLNKIINQTSFLFPYFYFNNSDWYKLTRKQVCRKLLLTRWRKSIHLGLILLVVTHGATIDHVSNLFQHRLCHTQGRSVAKKSEEANPDPVTQPNQAGGRLGPRKILGSRCSLVQSEHFLGIYKVYK